MVAATGVLVAAVYYVINIRSTQRNLKTNLETRQAQLFMPIYSTYYSDEFIRAFQETNRWKYDDYDDYMAKYSYETDPKVYIMYRRVFGYLEGMDFLVRRGLIDPFLVDDLMSGAIIQFWEKFNPIIMEYRRRRDWPQIGEQIEYLYNQIKPIVERQRRELETKTP